MSLEHRPGARSRCRPRLPSNPREGVCLLREVLIRRETTKALVERPRLAAAELVQLKGFVVVLVLIGFSACASGPYWTKAGVSRIELAQDDAACKREASEATPRSLGRGGGQTGRVWVNHWRYTDCMRVKGYRWATG